MMCDNVGQALGEESADALATDLEKATHAGQAKLTRAALESGSALCETCGAAAEDELLASIGSCLACKRERRHPLMEVVPSQPNPTQTGDTTKYFDSAALLDSVACGAVALLRGRFLAERKGRIERRQDLPPDAFFDVNELRRLIAALGNDWGLLFVAISYRWLTAEHPDPEGFHLAILARVAALYLKPNNAQGRHLSPLVEAFERASVGTPPDFAVLWDFGSLHQKPRTDEQYELFKRGLGTLPMWYGHSQTVCWMQTSLPEGFAERMAGLELAETYESSGWVRPADSNPLASTGLCSRSDR